MKFTTVEGENFKNYDEVEFSPTKTTCAIVGPNGRGKTTITQMIKYALTGDCPNDAVKAGKDTLSVKLSLVDDEGRVQSWERSKSNTRPSKVKVNDKTATGKALNSHIESITGIPIDSLRLSSSSELIEALKPSEFSDFIMGYIPEALDYDIVKGYMGTEVDPLAFKYLEDNNILPLTGKFGYDQLQTAYNTLFEQRKNTRSVLSTYEAKTKNVSLEKPEMTLNDVNKRLEEILKEEGGLANAKKALIAYNNAVEAKAKQDKLIADLNDKIAKISVDAPNPCLKSSIEAQKRELNSSIISLKSTIATLQKNIDMFKNTLVNLNKPTCPLSDGLICKTDKTAAKKEFEDQITSNTESINTINAEIAQKQKQFEDALAKEAAYIEQEKLYREKALLINQLENLKKSLIVLPPKPTAQEKVVDYTEEKQRLYKIQNDNIKYEQYLKDSAKFIELSKEKEILDQLVKLFAPKGDVTLKITKHYFGIFEDVCNERASELKPGFTLKFVPEDGIKILCETAPGVGYIPYQSCSSGERAFVIFLLTDLISNALTNSNILILDDLDKLDNEAFDSLMNCIMQPSVQDSYDHIIICAVDHDDTMKTLSKYPDIEVMKI